jgi:hypothetical protein
MAEEGMAPVSDLGTTDTGPAQQTTGADSAGAQSGQAPVGSQPPAEARTSGDIAPDDSFTDPSELPPELQAHYKRMQGSYTKKMQALSQQQQAQRQKIEAYDAFTSDPIGSVQRMAAQYGYTLSRGEAARAVQDAQAQQPSATQAGTDWQPNTWDEVLQKAEQRAEERIMRKLAPVLGSVRQMHAKTIERQLDEIDPEWRTYEDDMRQNIRAHPTLEKDVAKLYRLSVPDDVIERRATQKALKKFESKASGSRPSASTGPARTAETPAAVNSFDEAVAAAKKMLAQQNQGRR